MKSQMTKNFDLKSKLRQFSQGGSTGYGAPIQNAQNVMQGNGRNIDALEAQALGTAPAPAPTAPPVAAPAPAPYQSKSNPYINRGLKALGFLADGGYDSVGRGQSALRDRANVLQQQEMAAIGGASAPAPAPTAPPVAAPAPYEKKSNPYINKGLKMMGFLADGGLPKVGDVEGTNRKMVAGIDSRDAVAPRPADFSTDGRSIGDYWEASNEEFNARNPSTWDKVARAVSPITSLGYGAGKMSKGIKEGNFADAAEGALQVLPIAEGAGAVFGPAARGAVASLRGYADGGEGDSYGRRMGEAWSASNKAFEDTNPGTMSRVGRALNPMTGLGSAVGSMYDAAGQGSVAGMAGAAVSAVPAFGYARAAKHLPGEKAIMTNLWGKTGKSAANNVGQDVLQDTVGALADGGKRNQSIGGEPISAGGHVKGPGTGVSDDVGPVMLSDNEYVLPADTADAVGRDKLDALRLQTHDFQDPEKKEEVRRGLRGKDGMLGLWGGGTVAEAAENARKAALGNSFGDAAAAASNPAAKISTAYGAAPVQRVATPYGGGAAYVPPAAPPVRAAAAKGVTAAAAAPANAVKPMHPNAGPQAAQGRVGKLLSAVSSGKPEVVNRSRMANAMNTRGGAAGGLARGTAAQGVLTGAYQSSVGDLNSGYRDEFARQNEGNAIGSGALGDLTRTAVNIGDAVTLGYAGKLGRGISSAFAGAGFGSGWDEQSDRDKFLESKGGRAAPSAAEAAETAALQKEIDAEDAAAANGAASGGAQTQAVADQKYAASRLRGMGVSDAVQSSAPIANSNVAGGTTNALRTMGTKDFQNLGTYGGNANIYGKADNPANPGRINNFVGVGKGANASNEQTNFGGLSNPNGSQGSGAFSIGEALNPTQRAPDAQMAAPIQQDTGWKGGPLMLPAGEMGTGGRGVTPGYVPPEDDGSVQAKIAASDINLRYSELLRTAPPEARAAIEKARGVELAEVGTQATAAKSNFRTTAANTAEAGLRRADLREENALRREESSQERFLKMMEASAKAKQDAQDNRLKREDAGAKNMQDMVGGMFFDAEGKPDTQKGAALMDFIRVNDPDGYESSANMSRPEQWKFLSGAAAKMKIRDAANASNGAQSAVYSPTSRVEKAKLSHITQNGLGVWDYAKNKVLGGEIAVDGIERAMPAGLRFEPDGVRNIDNETLMRSEAAASAASKSAQLRAAKKAKMQAEQAASNKRN